VLHQPTITPDRTFAKQREEARHLHIANLIANRAQGYQRAMLASAGKVTTDTDYALIELLDAMQWLCDGDLTEQLADLCRENGLDTDGYHVNDDGDRCRFRDRELVIGGAL